MGANYKAAIQLPAYKLRYGLGTETAVTEGGKKTMKDVTKDVYQGRQKAARSFKSILGVRAAGEGQKNEIVIAPRKHRGPFPVYATRDRELLKCYDIVDNKGTKTMKSNKKTISSMGVMT